MSYSIYSRIQTYTHADTCNNCKIFRCVSLPKHIQYQPLTSVACLDAYKVLVGTMTGTQKDSFLNSIGEGDGDQIVMWKRKAEVYLIDLCSLPGIAEKEYMGVSKNRGTPKWMVYLENPIKVDDLGVPPFSETPMYVFFCCSELFFCLTSCGACKIFSQQGWLADCTFGFFFSI